MDHWPWKAPISDNRSQVCPMLIDWVTRHGKARQIRARSDGNWVCVFLLNSWKGNSCAQKLSAQLPCKLGACVLKRAWANPTAKHKTGAQNCAQSCACGPKLFLFKNQWSVPRGCWTFVWEWSGFRNPGSLGTKVGTRKSKGGVFWCRWMEFWSYNRDVWRYDWDVWLLTLNFASGHANFALHVGKGRRARQRHTEIWALGTLLGTINGLLRFTERVRKVHPFQPLHAVQCVQPITAAPSSRDQ